MQQGEVSMLFGWTWVISWTQLHDDAVVIDERMVMTLAFISRPAIASEEVLRIQVKLESYG